MQYICFFIQICANWENFHDPESGIAYYNVGIGSTSNKTDIANLTRFEHSVHEACITLPEEKYLAHGNIYYVIVWAYNGGHKRLNVSGVSNGGRSETVPIGCADLILVLI